MRRGMSRLFAFAHSAFSSSFGGAARTPPGAVMLCTSVSSYCPAADRTGSTITGFAAKPPLVLPAPAPPAGASTSGGGICHPSSDCMGRAGGVGRAASGEEWRGGEEPSMPAGLFPVSCEMPADSADPAWFISSFTLVCWCAACEATAADAAEFEK